MDRPVVIIETPEDPRLDHYRAIRDRDLRGGPERDGVFIGESRLVIERMLERGVAIRSVLVERRHVEWVAPLLSRFESRFGRDDTPLLVASADILRAIVGFDVHRGVLAVGVRPSPDRLTLDAAIPRRDRLTVLVVEDVNNADNIGGLYRNAAAFGVDAIVLSPLCHDHLYRKSIRVSLGHALTIPTARSTDWERDLRRLREEWGLELIAAATSADAVRIDAYRPSERVAIAVGAEFSGLSDAVLHLADATVRIPMVPGVDSLNVATAAAICLERLARTPRT